MFLTDYQRPVRNLLEKKMRSINQFLGKNLRRYFQVVCYRREEVSKSRLLTDFIDQSNEEFGIPAPSPKDCLVNSLHSLQKMIEDAERKNFRNL